MVENGIWTHSWLGTNKPEERDRTCPRIAVYYISIQKIFQKKNSSKLLLVSIKKQPICNFPQPPVTSSLSDQNIFSAPYSLISSICDLPKWWDPKCHVHTRQHVTFQCFTQTRTILFNVKSNRNLLIYRYEIYSFWTAWPFRTGMLASNYKPTPRNFPEERRPLLCPCAFQRLFSELLLTT